MDINQEQISKLEIQLEKLAPNKFGYLIFTLIILALGFVWEAVEVPLSGLAVGVIVLGSVAHVERVSHKRIELLKKIIELKMAGKNIDV